MVHSLDASPRPDFVVEVACKMADRSHKMAAAQQVAAKSVSKKPPHPVTPAEAGDQKASKEVDSGFRP
jgi:hypothetical protein